MPWTEGELRDRALRAYERGRVTGGLRRAALVCALATLSLVRCEHRAVGAAWILLLGVSVAALHWRGQSYGRGMRTGLLAGLAPFALPVGAQLTGHLCSSTVCLFLPTFCLAGGVAGGLLLGRAASRQDRAQVGSAVLVAVAAGGCGCALAGAAGALGMFVGLTAGGLAGALIPRQA
jgi:hypothetical protein